MATMKKKFWLCKRSRVFYLFDSESGKRTSLQTSSRPDAERLVQARNDSKGQPVLGLAVAKAYLSACDPRLVQRTWREVMDMFTSRGQPQTQALRKRRLRRQAFDCIRDKPLIETTANDFIHVLKLGGVMGHAFLRCLHNMALGLGWLPWPILPSKLWPEVRSQSKRGIARQEHQRILEAEQNPERRLYYDLLWETGASQTDAALLRSEQIDWPNRTLSYQRQKTGTWACQTIGPRLEAILRELPSTGPLFPTVGATTANARAAEFWRRCKLLGIRGVSLHSYRYGWAERAKTCGYPERYAQEALGHNSRAVHRAYARQAHVVLPALETYENATETRSSSAPATTPASEQAVV